MTFDEEFTSLIPGVHGRVERTPGISRLRMHEIFTEIWETMLFWYLPHME